MTISWDGCGPTGAAYNVSRMRPAETAFVFLGRGDGRNKSFTNTTAPAGTVTVQYSVRAVRGGDTSPPSAALIVRFSSADGAIASETA